MVLRRNWLVNLALLAGAVLAVAGAQTTRMAQGVVSDQRSRPLEHAIVQIKDTRSLAIRSYVTQADGAFHFSGLSRDIDYELTADYDGIRSSTHTLSHFDSRDTAEISLTVKLSK